MTLIGANTKQGIELAQQGHQEDALAYLRRAVTTETVNAEVWLWLASVTPDRQEYRHCVNQALILSPDHPTALRMQQDIDYQNYGAPPTTAAAQTSQALHHVDRSQRRRRRILLLLVLIVLVLGCGVVGQAVLNRIEQEDVAELLPFIEQGKAIQFAVGNETDAIPFVVDIPQTWYLADTGSPSWQTQKESLQNAIPDDFWEDIESDLGTVERIAATGEFIQPVVIVETNRDVIRQDPLFAATMRLLSLQTVSQDYPDNGCETIREIALTVQSLSQANPNFVAAEARQRDDDSCMYFVHVQDDFNGQPANVYTLSIPVGSEQLANWLVIIPTALQKDYENDIERIIDTLTSPAAEPTETEPNPDA